jgi:hypothetical protein
LVWRIVPETLPRKSPLIRLIRWNSEHERIESFHWAALELTDRLSDEERVRLRESGELTDWFSPELMAKAWKHRENRAQPARKLLPPPTPHL